MASLLLVGVHTRPAVSSAKILGCEVFSVDYFGSKDLKETADFSLSILEQAPYTSLGKFSENYSDKKLIELAEDVEADATILTSTLELRKKNVLGTSPKRMKKIKNKKYQLGKVRKLGFEIPETHTAKSREDVIELAKNFGFPFVIKPVAGSGGGGIKLIKSRDEIPEVDKDCLVQEYIRGTPISVSTLSTKSESIAISSSTQILGSKLLKRSGFGYCGSIVPYESETCELYYAAEEIADEFKVVGWNGIDFVDTGKGYVFMEMNPRFQGTLECIESAYGINLLEAHVKACSGELIEPMRAGKFSVRMTSYAGRRCMVIRDLSPYARDVPYKNVIIEKGEPIATVVTQGHSKSATVEAAAKRVKDIYSRFISPYSQRDI